MVASDASLVVVMLLFALGVVVAEAEAVEAVDMVLLVALASVCVVVVVDVVLIVPVGVVVGSVVAGV